MLKLDLGAGERSPDGFTPLGRDYGSEVFPLPYADSSVDEIRASHLLEHFPHGQIADVVADWVRALKPGGRLRIAVPDFAKLAVSYGEGRQLPYEGYLLGGQTDADDFHKSLFDRDRLRKLLAEAGLVLLRPWMSELADGAAMDISLNLEGSKPYVSELKVSAAMSVPRFGPMATMFCVVEACLACSVKLRQGGGAFWGQALTNIFERVLEEDGADLIVAIDYDSIFSPKHLASLIQLMMLHPEIDALAPIQSSRHIKSALFTVREGEANRAGLPRAELEPDTMPVSTAHFGLTLIRTEKLRQLPKPWFHSTPSAAGEWHVGDGHTDEDINFWRKWEAAGFSLHLANRVAIGHGEMVIRWPDINLEAFYQSTAEWQTDGAPEGVWK